MKHKLLYTLGFAVFASVGFGAAPAAAATTAVGPYYANPSWDQTLPSGTRFIVLSNMNDEAVLDRETGLVWERSPSTSLFTWESAEIQCINLNAGGRTGWRLPSIQELMSLVDRSVPVPGPTLPSGHPFSNVQSSLYWSATSSAADARFAWGVRLNVGFVFDGVKGDDVYVWCVRGGQVIDAQ